MTAELFANMDKHWILDFKARDAFYLGSTQMRINNEDYMPRHFSCGCRYLVPGNENQDRLHVESREYENTAAKG